MPSRQVVLQVARVAFLAACAAFLVWGFQGHGDDIADALTRVSAGGIVLAVGATLTGLAAMAGVWVRVTADFGMRIPVPQSASIYFLGQLGKYIPGSVWSIGAQAQMATAFQARPRVGAGAGLVTLGYFVASGGLVGAALAALGLVDAPWPRSLSLLAAAALAVSLTPPVITRAAKLVAGTPLTLTWTRTLGNLGLCAVLWAAWSVGVVAPFGDFEHIVTAAGAFGLCYAVGVLVFLAPAGLGAREALLIALLAPTTSVAHAAAIALVSRLVHATSDVTAALVAWGWAKRARKPSDPHAADADVTPS
jgi:uncharacterized membrane protein YbhN (UPF0104 family)